MAKAATIDIEAEAPAGKKPRFGKKLIIIAGAVLVLLVGGSVAAFMLLKSPSKAPAAEAAAEAPPESEGEGEGKGNYVEVPPLIVNLRSADGAARLIKLTVTLVPASTAKGVVTKAKLPLIIDSYQPFLRELRPEDLAGAAAVFRIKEELLVRANDIVGHGSVKDVLIEDLIQQ